MAKKILVVDDEPGIVDVIESRLRASGYEVMSAYDGQKALEMVYKNEVDLIILDIMLPKIDGYRVCGLLKNDSRYAHIPIILFTAKAQEEAVQEGEEAGANAYMMKPFDSQEVLKKIRELLEQ